MGKKKEGKKFLQLPHTTIIIENEKGWIQKRMDWIYKQVKKKREQILIDLVIIAINIIIKILKLGLPKVLLFVFVCECDTLLPSEQPTWSSSSSSSSFILPCLCLTAKQLSSNGHYLYMPHAIISLLCIIIIILPCSVYDYWLCSGYVLRCTVVVVVLCEGEIEILFSLICLIHLNYLVYNLFSFNCRGVSVHHRHCYLFTGYMVYVPPGQIGLLCQK